MKNTSLTLPDYVSLRYEYLLPIYTIRIEIEKVDQIYEYYEIDLPMSKWDRETIISTIIRFKYSAELIEAIIANILNDPLDQTRINEYKALQEWRIKAKEYATELMLWADEHNIGNIILQDEEEPYLITGLENKPDGLTMLAQGLTLLKYLALELDDERAIEVPALFPAWEDKIGQSVEVGERLFYDGRLWKVLQAHTIQSNWTPTVASSLYTEIVLQLEGEEELGTLSNPIPYNNNMVLEQGKYYSQDGVIYRCIRDSGNPVYHPLSALVGLYVEVVT